MVAEGDKVVSVVQRAALTKVTSWVSLQPESRSLLRASSFSRIVDSKFQEDWESMDVMYVLQRLGAVLIVTRSDK
jgi:hypothetical protein